MSGKPDIEALKQRIKQRAAKKEQESNQKEVPGKDLGPEESQFANDSAPKESAENEGPQAVGHGQSQIQSDLNELNQIDKQPNETEQQQEQNDFVFEELLDENNEHKKADEMNLSEQLEVSADSNLPQEVQSKKASLESEIESEKINSLHENQTEEKIDSEKLNSSHENENEEKISETDDNKEIKNQNQMEVDHLNDQFEQKNKILPSHQDKKIQNQFFLNSNGKELDTTKKLSENISQAENKKSRKGSSKSNLSEENNPQSDKSPSNPNFLEQIELTKRPDSPASPDVFQKSTFRVKTHSFSHDCFRLGLHCPDFSPLYCFFELLSKTSMFAPFDKNRSCSELNYLTDQIAQNLMVLFEDPAFKAIYFQELFYVAHKLFEFGQGNNSEAFVSVCSALLKVEAIGEADTERVIKLLHQAGWLSPANSKLTDFMLIESSVLVRAAVNLFLQENESHSAEAFGRLLLNLTVSNNNLRSFFECSSHFESNELEQQKFSDLLSVLNLGSAEKSFDEAILSSMISLIMHPIRNLRVAVIGLIRRYVSGQNVLALRQSQIFKELVFFLYLNKVYHNSAPQFSFEEDVKGIWAIAGKSEIKDTLSDNSEEFFTRYINLCKKSLQNQHQLPFELSIEDKSRVQAEWDFQLSTLIVAMDLYKNFLPDETLGVYLPKLVSLLNDFLSAKNQMIDVNRIIKHICFIIEDFQKRTLEQSLEEFFAQLRNLISSKLEALTKLESLVGFEKAIKLLLEPPFANEVILKIYKGAKSGEYFLPKESKELLSLMIFEHFNEENEEGLEGRSRIIKMELEEGLAEFTDSLFRLKNEGSLFFEKLSRLTKSEKTKSILAKTIIANAIDFASSIEQETDLASKILHWCRESVSQELSKTEETVLAERQTEALRKIKSLLINFDNA